MSETAGISDEEIGKMWDRTVDESGTIILSEQVEMFARALLALAGERLDEALQQEWRLRPYATSLPDREFIRRILGVKHE